MLRARWLWTFGVASGLILMSAGARAGGAKSFEDEMAHSAFFGFVRDNGGHNIADAKVTANFTTRHIKLIGRSDVTGQYMIPKLGNSNDPKTVEITCEKDGYNFAKAIPRDLVPKPNRPFEIDCYLAKK